MKKSINLCFFCVLLLLEVCSCSHDDGTWNTGVPFEIYTNYWIVTDSASACKYYVNFKQGKTLIRKTDKGSEWGNEPYIYITIERFRGSQVIDKNGDVYDWYIDNHDCLYFERNDKIWYSYQRVILNIQ